MSHKFKPLLIWMEERQRVFLKKEAGDPWPWTKDPILQKHKFCNVYREQDTVTKWIREHWREPYANHSNLWFAMCIARHVNWPPTLEKIGFPEEWEPKRVLKLMRKLREQGTQLYSGAYMLTAGGGNLGVDKPFITVEKILNPIYKSVQKIPPEWMYPPYANLETVWSWFTESGFYGFGPFMAYEVVSDLRRTRYLRNASDINTWANPGPGARRGLNRLYNRPLKLKPPREQLIEEMRVVFDWLNKNKNPDLLPTLEMRDVEHSLCEFDKNQRARQAIKDGERLGLDLYKRAGARLF
jgi:hypothetical protein